MAKFRFEMPKKEEKKAPAAPQSAQPGDPAPVPPPSSPDEEGKAGKFHLEAGKKDDDRKKPVYQQSAVIDSGIIRKVDEILEKSLDLEATDIHFEPGEAEVSVRCRTGGGLRQIESFPVEMHPKIINRIKVLSGMDITKNKLPQTGFFNLVTDACKIEIIARTFPTLRGEKALLKIQYKRGITLSLEELGMSPETLARYHQGIKKANGLVLLGGPPGNGKTTTLYATLNHLSSPEKSMAAFELVPKYEVPGLIQGKPDEKAEFSFDKGVESMLAMEPDVALIGEVQSPFVAKCMVQAAFAKRIVLARMSADNSVNALQNLIDMGLQPFLVSSAVNLVLAQRLVRKLCEECREVYEPPAKLAQELGLPSEGRFYRAKGCEKCQSIGYSGLTGIFEILVMNEELSEMIVGRESARRVREAAIEMGMVPLKQDGIAKALQGITSIEEVLNAI